MCVALFARLTNRFAITYIRRLCRDLVITTVITVVTPVLVLVRICFFCTLRWITTNFFGNNEASLHLVSMKLFESILEDDTEDTSAWFSRFLNDEEDDAKIGTWVEGAARAPVFFALSITLAVLVWIIMFGVFEAKHWSWAMAGVEVIFDVAGIVGAARFSTFRVGGILFAVGVSCRMVGSTTMAIVMAYMHKKHDVPAVSFERARTTNMKIVPFNPADSEPEMTSATWAMTVALIGEILEAAALMLILSKDVKIVTSILVVIGVACAVFLHQNGTICDHLIFGAEERGSAIGLFTGLAFFEIWINVIIPICAAFDNPIYLLMIFPEIPARFFGCFIGCACA